MQSGFYKEYSNIFTYLLDICVFERLWLFYVDCYKSVLKIKKRKNKKKKTKEKKKNRKDI